MTQRSRYAADRLLPIGALLATIALPALAQQFGVGGGGNTQQSSFGGGGTAADLNVSADVLGSGSASAGGDLVQSNGGYRQAAPDNFSRNRRIIEFTEPPLVMEKAVREPSPIITLRSSVQDRAKYPVNPNAPTVSGALTSEFGQLARFTFTLNGPDDELSRRRATTRALAGMVGRTYFEGNGILSRDLLEKYLDQNADRFIRASFVRNKTVRNGQPYFDLTLIIDQDALLKDMQEKRFIFRPKVRPFFFVYLDQTVDGLPDTSVQRGRHALEDAIRERNFRYADHGTPSFENPNVDITKTVALMAEGRKAAQRNEIEVVVTGTMTTRPTDLVQPTSEREWETNTLAVPVTVSGRETPVMAYLPLDLLSKRLQETLDARKADGLREWWDVGSIEIEVPVATLDLGASDRDEIESSALRPTVVIPMERIGLKRNYYTPHFYATTRTMLHLVRIDNGEVLRSEYGVATGSAVEREDALKNSVRLAAGGASANLLDGFADMWGRLILSKSEYRILAAGIGNFDADVLADFIQATDKRAKVFIRSVIGDVAVLTADYPLGEQALIREIERFPQPRLRLSHRSDKGIEFDSLGPPMTFQLAEGRTSSGSGAGGAGSIIGVGTQTIGTSTKVEIRTGSESPSSHSAALRIDGEPDTSMEGK